MAEDPHGLPASPHPIGWNPGRGDPQPRRSAAWPADGHTPDQRGLLLDGILLVSLFDAAALAADRDDGGWEAT